MPGLAEEGRVVVKEQREPDDPAAVLGEKHLRVPPLAEQVRPQLLFVEHDLIRQALVLGEPAD